MVKRSRTYNTMVKRRRTDNTMTKRKKETMVDETHHIELYESHKKSV
jgi:hypothetical protein